MKENKRSLLKDIGITLNFINNIIIMPFVGIAYYFYKCWEMAKQQFKEDYPNLY